MCGIWGVTGDFTISMDATTRFIRLSLANCDRGQMSHGLLIASAEAGLVKNTVLKGPGEADYIQILDDAFTKGLVDLRKVAGLFGHTRAPTGGTPNDFDNGHPFHIPEVGLYLAHNGILLNYAEIRAPYEKEYPKNIQTDSFAILYDIAYTWDAKHDATSLPGAVQEVCERLKGSFACWLWDTWMKEVYLFRCISSLYYKVGDDLLEFSSERFDGSMSLEEGRVLKFNAMTGRLDMEGRFKYYTPYVV